MSDRSMMLVPALEPATMIAGESGAAYDDLHARVRATVKPSDVFEEMWVREIADLAWEAARLRRLKANLMRACAHEGLVEALSHLHISNYGALADRWFAGDAAAAQAVNKMLAAAGLTIDSVMALTLSKRIDEVERIDRLTAMAEARRDTMLRDLERRRALLAANVRAALQPAEAA